MKTSMAVRSHAFLVSWGNPFPRWLLCTFLAIALTACSSFETYDQKGGPEIASKIKSANLANVKDATYKPGDYLDPASVTILMGPQTTSDEAHRLMCNLISPIVANGNPPSDFSIFIFDETGNTLIASDTDSCSVSVSSSP